MEKLFVELAPVWFLCDLQEFLKSPLAEICIVTVKVNFAFGTWKLLGLAWWHFELAVDIFN